MGKVFRYISDAALKPLKGYRRTCPVCAATGVDVYPASGNIVLEDGTEGDDCDAACVACLRAGRVVHISEWATDEEIKEYVRNYVQGRSASKRNKLEITLKEALRSTPRYPSFVQRDDWPLCCGDLTEYTGSPRSLRALIKLSKSAVYWAERKVPHPSYDPEEDGPPESLSEVSAFRCLHCEQAYWVFQCT